MSSARAKFQAAVLSVSLLLPASSAFAATHHAARYRHHRHHYSQTRGTAVGAVAGALIDHRHPLTGAVAGAVVGNVVQNVRNHKQ